MLVFIPSKGRARAITTHRLPGMAEVPFYIVVDNLAEYRTYLEAGVSRADLLMSNTTSLVGARQWILEQVAVGEWVMMMDDDIDKLFALEQPWYNEFEFPMDTSAETRRIWRPRFRHLMDMDEFLDHALEDIALAESMGINLIGYDQTENYMFRSRRYRTVEYVSFDTFIVRRTELGFDQELRSIDDYAFTAAHLARDGRVLVNHWIRPNASHYKYGGLGRRDPVRAAKRLHDIERIMAQYPGLYRLKKPRATDPFPWPDLAMKLHRERDIAVWRNSLDVIASRAAPVVH